MKPQQFRKVRDLYEAALEQPPEERTAFVEKACQDDVELRGEVQRLLIARAQTPGFLEKAILTNELQNEKPARLQYEGRVIGAYEVRAEIGRGGMGVVYEAHRADDAFRNRVALKIVRPEATSEEVLRRFQQEREILARLDHPNI